MSVHRPSRPQSRFPGPVAASDPSSQGLSSELRRFPRMNVTGETFRNLRNGKTYAVTDLSSGGFSLRMIDDADLLLYPAGAEIRGRLRLRDLPEPLPVEARVRHVERGRVGLEFVSANDVLERELAAFLSPARVGRSLRLSPGGTLDCLWYRGGAAADLWVWPSAANAPGAETRIERWVLRAHGIVVVYEGDAPGLVTGTAEEFEPHAFQEGEEEWGLLHFETIEMRRDGTPDGEKMRIAKAILLSCNERDPIRFACAAVL